MPKIEPQALDGSAALLALLDVIRNPQAYEAKVKELKELIADVNTTVSRVGQAEAIPALHEQAQSDRQEASRILQAAKVDAAETKKAALADRDVARGETARLRATIAELLRDQAALDSTWNTRAAEREAAIAQREAAAEKDREAAESTRRDAEALKAEWQERVDKLKGAMA